MEVEALISVRVRNLYVYKEKKNCAKKREDGLDSFSFHLQVSPHARRKPPRVRFDFICGAYHLYPAEDNGKVQ